MKKIGNFFWFIFIGLWTGIIRYLFGVVCCLTIIGIPFGIQSFKIAKLSFFPFKKYVDTDFYARPIANFLFVIFGGGFVTGVIYKVLGVFFSITVIGLPLGKQFLKISKLVWAPFGSHVFQ